MHENCMFPKESNIIPNSVLDTAKFSCSYTYYQSILYSETRYVALQITAIAFNLALLFIVQYTS